MARLPAAHPVARASCRLPEGRYNLWEAQQKGLHDNEASSLRVGYGSHAGAAGNCKDNYGWVDQYGHGCKEYEKDGHCAGGHVLHEWVASGEFKNPQYNCCSCG